jgi:hypothetical protein
MARIEMRKCDAQGCEKTVHYPELSEGWIEIVGGNKKIKVHGKKAGFEKSLSSKLDYCSKECMVKDLMHKPTQEELDKKRGW